MEEANIQPIDPGMNQNIQPTTESEAVIVSPEDKCKVTSEIAKEWYQQYRREGHSIASTNTYYSYINRYVGKEVILNQRSINRFRNKNMSTAASGALKSLFNFLVIQKEFPEDILNLRFSKSKSIRKAPEFFSSQEVERIIGSMENMRDKMLTRVLAECGLRISEAMKLQWADFTWSEWLKNKAEMGSLILKKTKGDKFRTIPVSSELMNLLYDAHESRDLYGIPVPSPGSDNPLLFDFGLKEYRVMNEKNKEKEAKDLNDYLIYAGNTYRKMLYRITSNLLGKNAHPHMFRHYAAQGLLNEGLAMIHIKEFMGHSSLSSTEIYAKSSAEALKREIKKLREKNGK